MKNTQETTVAVVVHVDVNGDQRVSSCSSPWC
jgi:hypothetical protein